jgi:hypothetical protein
MDEFWADITLYMDKLHSMELLLLEELDQCEIKLEELDILSLETNSDTSALHSAFRGAALGLNYLSREDVMKCVNELSSKELKHSVISFLTQSEYKHPVSQDATTIIEPKQNFDPIQPCNSEEEENPELKDWEISLYDVEFQKRIGRGAAGTTYLAKWVSKIS